jgi:hypothetical protein
VVGDGGLADEHSCADIRVRQAVARQSRDLRLLGSEVIAGLDAAFARVFAGRDAGLEAHIEARLRFAGDNLMDALAPTNFLWSNPTAIKATVEEGRANLLRGIRNLAELLAPPHLPAMVDSSAFTVGENLAATPGVLAGDRDPIPLVNARIPGGSHP